MEEGRQPALSEAIPPTGRSEELETDTTICASIHPRDIGKPDHTLPPEIQAVVFFLFWGG